MKKSRRIDPDISIVKACVRALNKSSSREMLRANLVYLWDRFLAHPSKEMPEHLTTKKP